MHINSEYAVSQCISGAGNALIRISINKIEKSSAYEGPPRQTKSLTKGGPFSCRNSFLANSDKQDFGGYSLAEMKSQYLFPIK